MHCIEYETNITLYLHVNNILPGHNFVTGEDKAPTRKQLDMIASNIGYKWKEFLRELEFEESLIDQLHIDFKKSGTYEVVYQGLQKWVKRQGKSASLKFLFECLCKLDYEDIAEKLLT